MTKVLNFALKIKGGGKEDGTCEVLRPCHPPKKFGTCTWSAPLRWLPDGRLRLGIIQALPRQILPSLRMRLYAPNSFSTKEVYD